MEQVQVLLVVLFMVQAILGLQVTLLRIAFLREYNMDLQVL